MKALFFKESVMDQAVLYSQIGLFSKVFGIMINLLKVTFISATEQSRFNTNARN